MPNDDILFQEMRDRRGQVLAIITLNKPQKLNALSFSMITKLYNQLVEWQKNPAIKAVLVKSNSNKAFCAGGDLRTIYDHRQLSASEKKVYFEIEYRLDLLIHEYSKPYISLINGIVMGGGVGISFQGSHPVASDNVLFAMPETKLGFFPDAGICYYFSRLKNHIGFYLGLTGNTMYSVDLHDCGLVSHFVAAEHFDALEKKLFETHFTGNDPDVVTGIIDSFQLRFNKKSSLESLSSMIDAAFSKPTVETILAALPSGNIHAAEIKDTLKQRSPLGLKITLMHLQRCQSQSMKEVMHDNLHLATQLIDQPDFYEGIRAVLIDKDNRPKWTRTLEEISIAEVKKYFD